MTTIIRNIDTIIKLRKSGNAFFHMDTFCHGDNNNNNSIYDDDHYYYYGIFTLVSFSQ